MKKYQISFFGNDNKETLKLDVDYENLSKLFIALSLLPAMITKEADCIQIKEIE